MKVHVSIQTVIARYLSMKVHVSIHKLKYHICYANLVDSGCLDLDCLGVLRRKQPHFEAGYSEGVEDGTFAPGKKIIL